MTNLLTTKLKPDMALAQTEVNKASSALYDIFFTDPANKAKVNEIFDRIHRADTYTLPDVTSGTHVQKGSTNQTLEFLCIYNSTIVNGTELGDPEDFKFWQKYQGNTTNDSNYWTTEDVQVSPSIWVWPPFFNPFFTPVEPNSTFCDKARSQLLAEDTDDDYLAHTQYGSIIKALANKYLGVAPVDSSITWTIYGFDRTKLGIQGAVGLNATEQALNPQNYAFFASGELKGSPSLVLCKRGYICMLTFGEISAACRV